jgi:hypothetical protein
MMKRGVRFKYDSEKINGNLHIRVNRNLHIRDNDENLDSYLNTKFM